MADAGRPPGRRGELEFVRPLGNVVDNPFSIGIRRDS